MIIGIDPGQNGALAFVSADLEIFEAVKLTPAVLMQIRASVDLIVVERVWGRPHDTPKTAFSLGKSVGWIECALEFLPYKEILWAPPIEWQATIHAGISRADYPDPKKRSAIALKKYKSHCKIPGYAIDSACIAIYGALYLNEGKNVKPKNPFKVDSFWS